MPQFPVAPQRWGGGGRALGVEEKRGPRVQLRSPPLGPAARSFLTSQRLQMLSQEVQQPQMLLSLPPEPSSKGNLAADGFSMGINCCCPQKELGSSQPHSPGGFGVQHHSAEQPGRAAPCHAQFPYPSGAVFWGGLGWHRGCFWQQQQHGSCPEPSGLERGFVPHAADSQHEAAASAAPFG